MFYVLIRFEIYLLGNTRGSGKDKNMIGIGEENMRVGPRERKCEMRSGPIEKNMRGGSKERKCERREGLIERKCTSLIHFQQQHLAQPAPLPLSVLLCS